MCLPLPLLAVLTVATDSQTISASLDTRGTDPIHVSASPISKPIGSLDPESGTTQPLVVKDTSDLPDPRDRLFTRCFHQPEKVFLAPSRDFAKWNFTTNGPQACWEYCQQIRACRKLAFDYLTSTCFLIKHGTSNTPAEKGFSQPEISNIGTLLKSCVERLQQEQSSISIQSALELGREGKGVLIDTGVSMDICLSVGQRFLDGWLLEWVRCSEAPKFILKEVTKESRSGQYGLLQIYDHRNNSLCVNVTLLSSFAIAYLAPCHDDVKETAPQTLKIRYSYGLSYKNITFYGIHSGPVFSTADGSDYVLFLDEGIDFSRRLETVLFRLPNPKLRHACSVKQFQLPHSTIVGGNNAPILLPGSTVTILCDPGYGVRVLGYYPYQVVTCLTDQSSPPPCRKTPPEGCARFCDLYFVGVVVMAVVAFVLALGRYFCWRLRVNNMKLNKGNEGQNGPRIDMGGPAEPSLDTSSGFVTSPQRVGFTSCDKRHVATASSLPPQGHDGVELNLELDNVK